jgi:hypothetical protein
LPDLLRERFVQRDLRRHFGRTTALERSSRRLDVTGTHDDLLHVVACRLQPFQDRRGQERELVRPCARRRDDGQRLELDPLRDRAIGDARAHQSAPRQR